MIPLNFYRDDEYVYYNNPNGITKKISIADFESMMSGESELPEYSSSSQGKVLSVDSDGDLEWASLPPDELPAYSSSDADKVLTVNDAGTGVEWAEPSDGLPSYSAPERGMVLTVAQGGDGVAWAKPVGIEVVAGIVLDIAESTSIASNATSSLDLTPVTIYDPVTYANLPSIPDFDFYVITGMNKSIDPDLITGSYAVVYDYELEAFDVDYTVKNTGNDAKTITQDTFNITVLLYKIKYTPATTPGGR